MLRWLRVVRIASDGCVRRSRHEMMRVDVRILRLARRLRRGQHVIRSVHRTVRIEAIDHLLLLRLVMLMPRAILRGVGIVLLLVLLLSLLPLLLLLLFVLLLLLRSILVRPRLHMVRRDLLRDPSTRRLANTARRRAEASRAVRRRVTGGRQLHVAAHAVLRFLACILLSLLLVVLHGRAASHAAMGRGRSRSSSGGCLALSALRVCSGCSWSCARFWLLVRSSRGRVVRRGDRAESLRGRPVRLDVSGAVGSVGEGARALSHRTREGTIARVRTIMRLQVMLLHELNNGGKHKNRANKQKSQQ